MFWLDWFLSLKGNEFFCEVDEEYILDRFNLTGLNTECPYYNEAYELLTEPIDAATFDSLGTLGTASVAGGGGGAVSIANTAAGATNTSTSGILNAGGGNAALTSSSSTALNAGHMTGSKNGTSYIPGAQSKSSSTHNNHGNNLNPGAGAGGVANNSNNYNTSSASTTLTTTQQHRAEVEASARHLYGLIHARYVITARGQLKMFEKMRHAEFGRCPRVLCHNQPVLPVGLSDLAGVRNVMLYCPRCEDVYSPPTRRHAVVDGAYFGTTFPHLLIMMYPQLAPARSQERYVPKIFGFRIHRTAVEMAKQDEMREGQVKRINSANSAANAAAAALQQHQHGTSGNAVVAGSSVAEE